MFVEDRRAHWGLAPGIQRYIEASMELITIQLAPAEVLAIYSFLALGARWCAGGAGAATSTDCGDRDPATLQGQFVR